MLMKKRAKQKRANRAKKHGRAAEKRNLAKSKERPLFGFMAGQQKSVISRNRKSALYLDSWPGSSRSSAMLNRRFWTGHTGALQRINRSEDKMFPTDVVIVAGARTPMARYAGAFSEVSAIELAAHASKEAIRRSGVDPGEFDHAIFGNV